MRRQLKRESQGDRAAQSRPGGVAQGRAGGVAAPGLGFRRGERLPPRRQPRAAGQAAAGARAQAGRYSPARQAGRAGDLELRRRPAGAIFESRADDDESARRAALARWITDPRNPLTWRSIVNRVWHWHFGRGLVSTPSDFGRMGALPSHPELLDWLADQFLESGGSLKSLHRLIVTSAVYRQSVRHDASFAAIDGDNQWLWRQNRRRLDAESIHDAILAVAGRLDPTMRRPVGPAVCAAARRARHAGRRLHASTTGTAPAHAGAASIAFFSARSPTRSSTRSTAADASQLTAVRNESTTPLQALELLNNPFVLRQCEAVARAPGRAATAVAVDEQVERGHRAGLRPRGDADEVRASLGLRRPPRTGEPVPAHRQ